MKRRWSCMDGPEYYTLVLKYGDMSFTSCVSKRNMYHTISVGEYLRYHITRLNLELREAVFPLTR